MVSILWHLPLVSFVARLSPSMVSIGESIVRFFLRGSAEPFDGVGSTGTLPLVSFVVCHLNRRVRWCQGDALRSNAFIERSLDRHTRRRGMWVLLNS